MKITAQFTIKLLFIVTILSVGFLLGACSSEDTQQQNSMETRQMEMDESAEQAVVYTCPMHPEVTSEEPGECPECGMNLVVAEEDAMQHEGHAGEDSDMEHNQ